MEQHPNLHFLGLALTDVCEGPEFKEDCKFVVCIVFIYHERRFDSESC